MTSEAQSDWLVELSPKRSGAGHHLLFTIYYSLLTLPHAPSPFQHPACSSVTIGLGFTARLHSIW